MDPRQRVAPDLEAARKQATAALRRKPRRTSIGREAAERELRFLLWSELGAWSSGWHDPIAAGGANRVWTGAASVGDDDAETVERVLAAIDDWQGWLGELSEAFEPIAAATAGLDDVDAAARVASEMLARVLERTGAQGDWARTFSKATSWCLQACGRAHDDSSALVAKAIEGHVERGVAPAGTQDLIEELALEVAVREKPPFCDDALETWWVARAAAPWGSPSPPDFRPVEGDGHRRYIRHADRPRSTVRADAMTRALVRARYGAKQPLKLDVGLLREWLELALMSNEITIRKSDVTSRDQGERYGRPKDLEKRLAQALTDATATDVPTIGRAARLYMDLRCLRPFTDGNARVARLAFDYVLSRDGLGLHDATPVFAVRRWAHDPTEPWRFQKELAACVGPA